jgi:outer membrane protein
MKVIVWLISAMIVCPLSAANAAEDLLDAYEAGRRFDPRFQAARFQYEAAREKIPQARAELLPSISFDASRARVDQNIRSRQVQVPDQIVNNPFPTGKEEYTNKAWSFQARQTVFRMSSFVQLSQSKAVVRQAYANFVAAEQALILRTAALYLNLLAAQDGLDLAEAELAAVGRQLELVQAQRRGGLASVTDEYEAEARYTLVEADIVEAQYALDDAYQALRELVGDSVTSVMRLQNEIPLVPPAPADVTVWVEQALDQNLTLKARLEAVDVAEHEVRRVRAGHLPTLDLEASHRNLDEGGAVTGGASDTDWTEYTLRFNLPIYSGGFVSSRTREASMNHQRALQERKLQHRVTMRETRAAYQGVISAISRVEAFDASLQSQASLLEGRAQGYRSGVNTLLEVLDAESDLYETRRDYAQARYQYLINLLQLKLQNGTLSEDDLEYLNGLLDRGSIIIMSDTFESDTLTAPVAFGPVQRPTSEIVPGNLPVSASRP